MKIGWRHLVFEEAYCDGKYMWMVNNLYNALFRLDMKTFEAKFCGMLPIEQNYAVGRYREVLNIGRKIYFFPMGGENHIVIYDLDKEDFQLVETGERELNISFATVYDGKIWMFPFNIKFPLMSMEINSLKLKKHMNWNKKVSRSIKIDNSMFDFINSVLRDSSVVYTPVANSSILLETDLKNMDIKFHDLGAGYHVFSCGYDTVGRDIYISLNDSYDILRLHEEDGSPHQISGPYDTGNAKLPYGKMLVIKNQLLIIPWLCDEIILFDLRTEKYTCMEYPQQYTFFDGTQDTGKFLGYYVTDNNVYLFPRKSDGIIEVDLASNRIINHQIKFPEQLDEPWFYKNIIIKKIEEKPELIESEELDQEYFLNAVKYDDDKPAVNIKSNIGLKVYNLTKPIMN